jgi:hypothetical protein
MLSVLNRIASLVPPLVYAGLLAALALGIGLQTWRLGNAKEELGAARVAVDQAVGVNEHNGGVIKVLELAGRECVAGRETDEKKFIVAEAKWEAQKEMLRFETETILGKRIEVFRDPTCAEFAQLDIGNVCPAIVNSLRLRASRINRIRNRGENRSSQNSDS